jgi:hypothetical protein
MKKISRRKMRIGIGVKSKFYCNFSQGELVIFAGTIVSLHLGKKRQLKHRKMKLLEFFKFKQFKNLVEIISKLF